MCNCSNWKEPIKINRKISFNNNIIMNNENYTYIFKEEGNGRTYPAQLCSYLNSFFRLV